MSNMSNISGLSGFSSPPPEVFGKDFRDMEVYADLNFLSEPSPLTGSSVETTSTIFSDSSSDSEKQKLVSIENLVAADRTSSGNIYDVPPQGVRKVERTGGDMNNVNVRDLTAISRNELGVPNAMPRRSSRDELNISPELDNVDGCGMILDGEVDQMMNNEAGVNSQLPTKRRLESTTSSHSHTSGDSTSSVSISVGSSASMSSQPHLPPSTSASDIDMFLTTVQRNVEVLSPKLPKCDQPKVTGLLVGSSSSSRSSETTNGSGSCLFESHGQLREPDTESLDLLDEVLRACNVDAFSSSSGGHSSSHGSTRDLCVRSIHSSTCSIGSANQTGDATSDSSTRTSPAQGSPAQGSPSPAPVNSPLPPPPPLPPRPRFNQQAALPVTVDVHTAKCHKHSYVNVSGINSVSNTGQNSSVMQTVPSLEQQPVQRATVAAGERAAASASKREVSCLLTHDYVNIWSDNGVNADQSSLAMQQQHPQSSSSAATSTPLLQPDANSNPSVPSIPSEKSDFLNPSKPLPFVDLDRFDSKDEGYLYWVKATSQTGDPPVIVTDPSLGNLRSDSKSSKTTGEYIQMKAAGILNYTDSQVITSQKKNIYSQMDNKSQPNLSKSLPAEHQLDYVNMTPDSTKSVAARLSGKLLSYHNSLKRSKKPEVQPRASPVDELLRRSTSPRGSPKSDRNSLRTELFRSRGKSLENILDSVSCGTSTNAEAGRPFDIEGQGINALRSNSDEGDYVQLNTKKRSPLPTRTSPGIISQANLTVPSDVSRANSYEEESPYAVMSGERHNALLENSGSPYAFIEGPEHTYIQMGHQDIYAPLTGMRATNNPFAKSPSPKRSPRVLRRTPPCIGAISPHTSPKKIRSHVSESGDYMMMRGYPKDDDDSAIFCAMELPLRSGSYSSPMRSRNCSFSSNTSSETFHGEERSYMSMNIGRNRSNSNQSQRSVDHMVRRPPLNQSRSLDNELEGDYLHMNLGQDGAKGGKHSDYMCMTPPGDDGAGGRPQGSDQDRVYAGASIKPLRPFEDLIEHEPFVTKKPIIPPKPPGLGRRPSSAGASSKSEDGIKSPTPGKRERFLSRLIRRNSSKERKSAQSKSQEDILSSPVAEPLPEVPISEPNTPSPFTTRPPQDPFGLCGSPRLQRRRASVDVLSQVPGIGSGTRGRSASYSCQGWTELANLTDEQKQQSCLSIASSSSSHQSHDTSPSSGPEFGPTLPPRTYTKNRSADMVESPAYMLVLPGAKVKPDPPPPTPSPIPDIPERPVSPNMPTEPAPPPPIYVPGIAPEVALSYTDSNPNSTNTSTLTLLHISEEDDMMPIPPPILPEKTNRRKSSPGSMLGASLSLLRRQSSRRSQSPTWHSQSELLLTDDSKASSASASPLTMPRSRRGTRLTVHIPVTDDEDDLWSARSAPGETYCIDMQIYMLNYILFY